MGHSKSFALMASGITTPMQQEADRLREIQGHLQKAIMSRQQYMTQLNENQMVKKEFGLLDQDQVVFKQVGPILVKQDLTEAKTNVDTRIDFIGSEMKRIDARIKDLEKQEAERKEKVM